MTDTTIPTTHWADHAANEIIQRHPNKNPIVCAAGISPSGRIHIGNFREVITVELVVRALEKKGKQVRFLFSWDDYDALRKVPKNLPNPETLETHLRKPISDIPDPFGSDRSYAGHFETLFQDELAKLGVQPEYLYQNQAYRQCHYNEGVKTALAHEKEIKAILDEVRTKPLPDDWSCITIYCQQCGTDITKRAGYEAPIVQFHCKKCKQDFQCNVESDPGAKLLWRVDWPMRWHREKVDFEPCGKDHSSPGGSFQTGEDIIRKIWKTEPPYNFGYDFVVAKGLGAKLSSSSGTLISLTQALEVYEARIIRYLFASRKPNLDFHIAFDLDVMKAYDDFDRTERIALKMEEAEDKKYYYDRRIYELSQTERGKPIPEATPIPQFPFRHLCNILQIYGGDFTRAQSYFADQIKTPEDEQRYQERAHCAWNWITQYAPEAFRFALRTENDPPPQKTTQEKAVQALVDLLISQETFEEEALAQSIFKIMKSHELKPKTFFSEIYQILINKPNGPKLAPFLNVIGPTRAADILRKAL